MSAVEIRDGLAVAGQPDRIQQIRISPGVFLSLVQRIYHPTNIIVSAAGLPEHVSIVQSYYNDLYDYFVAVVRSDVFPVVEQGAPVPDLTITFTRHDTHTFAASVTR